MFSRLLKKSSLVSCTRAIHFWTNSVFNAQFYRDCDVNQNWAISCPILLLLHDISQIFDSYIKKIATLVKYSRMI